MDIQHKTNEQLHQELLELQRSYNSLEELYAKGVSMQKDAHDEMLKTNLKLTLALQGGNMAWWEMDVPTGNVTFDKHKVEMLGYLPEKFTHYSHFTALVHPDDSKRLMNAMKGHLEGTLDKYEAEYRILASSGEYVWFSDYGSVVKKDAKGIPLICAGFVFNISDRKKAEKSQLKIMKALDSTSDSIGISDSQGRHIYQNKALSDLFGYETVEETEAAGGGRARIKDPAVAKQLFKTILNGKSWSGELEMVTKSGRVFPAFERADAITDKEGNRIGIIGIITDLTERRQTEEKFRKSENMLQTVLDNFPGVVFWKDRQSNYLGCNQSFAIGAGLKRPAEIIGKTDLELPWALTEAINYIKDDVAVMESDKGRLHIIETQHQSNGQVTWFNTSKFPLRDSSGQVIGVIGVSNDISMLKMAEQELINKNKELVVQNEEKAIRAEELMNAISKIIASDRNLRESQKIARLGTFEVDILKGVCITSEILNELFGIDENHDTSISGRAALLHPEDREMVLNRFLNDLNSNMQPADIEFRIVRHNDK
ncbi:MAG: PAS domain S-box protein, partial [Bacteroidales bacterium]